MKFYCLKETLTRDCLPLLFYLSPHLHVPLIDTREIISPCCLDFQARFVYFEARAFLG